ncbi:transketolase, N-terminal subunit [Clostridia bacterium]|nr:transketolase, N-terminal subunit [Clostridia bacterium]
MNSVSMAWLIRRHCIEMTARSGGSHIGSALSVADILAVLYTGIMQYSPVDPYFAQRDRLIMSKGHAGLALYAALAEGGFYPVKDLSTYYQDGSLFSGHTSHHVPGVELSTGSLGHGLPVAAGIALAGKMDGKAHRVFVILGDGECDEGSVWEAALFAAHYRLCRLVTIIDHNKMQSMDFCERTIALGNLSEKWRAFGWNVLTVDGHDHMALAAALATDPTDDRPTAIIAHTIKGHGVPFMENDILWHYRFPHQGWEYDQAVAALWKNKPIEIDDIYTPVGIPDPTEMGASSCRDHTMCSTWRGLFWRPDEHSTPSDATCAERYLECAQEVCL